MLLAYLCSRDRGAILVQGRELRQGVIPLAASGTVEFRVRALGFRDRNGLGFRVVWARAPLLKGSEIIVYGFDPHARKISMELRLLRCTSQFVAQG